MKKMLALLLAVMMVLSLAACGDAQTDGEATTTSEEAVTTTENQGEADATTTTVTAIVENSTTTKTTTTSKPYSTTVVPAPTTTKAATLNPKTSFKFGTYKAAFFENNKQIYRKVSLEFYKEFETVQAGYTDFYTIEQCKKQYESWGSDFDENNFSYENKLTVGGVTYYDIGNWGSLPTSYELTDTIIKTGEGDASEGHSLGAFAEFSLNQDGTLKLKKDHSVFGKAGTIYTLAE